MKWFDYQEACFEHAAQMSGPERLCLYYRTGAGKTLTALQCLKIWGHKTAVVVAPPSTHEQWIEAGIDMGIGVHPMSHAKFRMKSTQMSRDVPVIADEFHLFGGHRGQGWKKLDRLAQGLRAPLVLASATPNYNDAERVYCIQHILDPQSVRGGYLQFLYEHCTTEHNNFGMEPIVTGFRNFPNAASYLAALPNVMFLPDDVVYTIEDRAVEEKIPPAMDEFGYNPRRHRMIASQIEERHTIVNLSLIGDDGRLEDDVHVEMDRLIKAAKGPVLVYCNHSSVAEVVAQTYAQEGWRTRLVTGKTPARAKQAMLDEFRDGRVLLLVGTASLATGTDGLDKVCDTLIILDDTDDDALRRQVIGRIMPRGADSDASKKRVHRLVLQ